MYTHNLGDWGASFPGSLQESKLLFIASLQVAYLQKTLFTNSKKYVQGACQATWSTARY